MEIGRECQNRIIIYQKVQLNFSNAFHIIIMHHKLRSDTKWMNEYGWSIKTEKVCNKHVYFLFSETSVQVQQGCDCKSFLSCRRLCRVAEGLWRLNHTGHTLWVNCYYFYELIACFCTFMPFVLNWMSKMCEDADFISFCFKLTKCSITVHKMMDDGGPLCWMTFLYTAQRSSCGSFSWFNDVLLQNYQESIYF